MPIFLISGPTGQGRDELARALSTKPLDLTKARLTHPITYIIDLNNALNSFGRDEMCVVTGITDLAEVDHVRRLFPERTVTHCHCRVDSPTDKKEIEMLCHADFVVAETATM